MSVRQRYAQLQRHVEPVLPLDELADVTLVVLGALAFAAQSLLVMRVPPVTGYERSLLAAFPLAFWVCFGVSFASAIVGLVHTGLKRGRYLGQFTALLVANYAVLFFLPVFRGYRLYGRGQADKLLHLAEVAEILSTGGFDALFYPVVHVFVAELSALSGLSPRVAALVASLVLTLLYVVSTGVLLRAFFGSPGALPLGMAASAPFLFGDFYVSLTPAVLSFFFVPLALFAVERYRRARTRGSQLLAVFFVVVLVPFHPVTALFAVALLGTTAAYTDLVARYYDASVRQLPHYLWAGTLALGVGWYGQFQSTRYFVTRVVDAWLYGTQSLAASQAERTSEAGLTTVELLVRAVQLYGAIGVYLALLAAFVCYAGYRMVGTRHEYPREYIILQAGVGGCLAVLFLFGYFVAFDVVRISRYLLLFATLSVGALLVAARRSDYERSVTTVLTLCILLSAGLSVATVYPVNNHMTAAEFEGATYALAATDDSSDVYSLNTNGKTEMFVTGDRDTGEHTFVAGSTDIEALLNGSGPPGERTDGTYLATKSYDTEYYTSDYYFDSQREQLRHVTDAEVVRLSERPGVQRLYSNGGYTLWYLSGNATGS